MDAIQKFLEEAWQFITSHEELFGGLFVTILIGILGSVAALARWV